MDSEVDQQLQHLSRSHVFTPSPGRPSLLTSSPFSSSSSGGSADCQSPSISCVQPAETNKKAMDLPRLQCHRAERNGTGRVIPLELPRIEKKRKTVRHLKAEQSRAPPPGRHHRHDGTTHGPLSAPCRRDWRLRHHITAPLIAPSSPLPRFGADRAGKSLVQIATPPIESVQCHSSMIRPRSRLDLTSSSTTTCSESTPTRVHITQLRTSARG
nr:unnamed protein product [Digitaria exilis]